MRWSFGGENIDVRSLSPAESFTAETQVPPVVLLDEEMAKMQDPSCRPKMRNFTVEGRFPVSLPRSPSYVEWNDRSCAR